mmetsp:Transcript_56634/g.99040  ORF Transcript_56634/g.99040 Transcript_56634/m.99040 type:complete len:117 (-) Transcript_56634:485-835(-)
MEELLEHVAKDVFRVKGMSSSIPARVPASWKPLRRLLLTTGPDKLCLKREPLSMPSDWARTRSRRLGVLAIDIGGTGESLRTIIEDLQLVLALYGSCALSMVSAGVVLIRDMRRSP